MIIPGSNQSYMDEMIRMQNKYHPDCLFRRKEYSMVPEFDCAGHLHLRVICNKKFQSYNGIVHGGVLSALFDHSMMLCLFGHGFYGYTVRLNIKYSDKVKINSEFTVSAKIVKMRQNTAVELTGAIVQNAGKRAGAEAVFWLENKK